MPFTIAEHYVPHDPNNASMTAVYRKSVSAPFHIPGGSLVGMPTAIARAVLSSDKSRYDSVAIFSCLSLVQELVIATRSPSVDESELQALIKDLGSRGVPLANDKLNRVDWTKCKKDGVRVVV